MRTLSTLAASLTAVLFLLTLGCPALSHSDEHEEGTNPPGDHNYFDFGNTGGGGHDDDDVPGDDDDMVGDDDDAVDYGADNVTACEDLEDFIAALECMEGEPWDMGCDKYMAFPCDLSVYFDCLTEETFCGEFGPDLAGWKDCAELFPTDCM
jgi:hypothetical protein